MKFKLLTNILIIILVLTMFGCSEKVDSNNPNETKIVNLADKCGDGRCSVQEARDKNCPKDCDNITKTNQTNEKDSCGNNRCESGETKTCPKDCEYILEKLKQGFNKTSEEIVCGDGSCSENETCPQDCGKGVCGDDVCSLKESFEGTCPVDCK